MAKVTRKPKQKPKVAAKQSTKRPSKAKLKSVLANLKKEADLLTTRKALKYIPYYLKSEGLTKKLLKEVIRLWAESGEKIRVVCLLCLIRIYTKLRDKERKQLVIKSLYNTFLDKCRVTKHETMSMIGFMRHSLIELYKLDIGIALKQAQTSCQQLTVTLKNACTHKNEETYKSVLNWQFANCLILLSSFIVSQDEDSPIRTLTHQVVQLNLGALSLLSSPRYYPYYCHLMENLISLSEATGLFIPVLPLMVDMVCKIHFDDKKHVDNDDDEKEAPNYNMDLLNHVSADEALSPDYKTAVLGRLHDLILRYLSSHCHKIAFPELVLLPCVQLKRWVKTSHAPEAPKFKLILDKVKEDCEKIEDTRKSVSFTFTNYPAIDAWEKKMRDANSLKLQKATITAN